jgi:hypothetical protein
MRPPLSAICVSYLFFFSADIKKIEAVKAVENAMTNLSTSLSNGNKGGITHGVAQVYKNQQQLDQEVKSLQAQTAKFAKYVRFRGLAVWNRACSRRLFAASHMF